MADLWCGPSAAADVVVTEEILLLGAVAGPHLLLERAAHSGTDLTPVATLLADVVDGGPITSARTVRPITTLEVLDLDSRAGRTSSVVSIGRQRRLDGEGRVVNDSLGVRRKCAQQGGEHVCDDDCRRFCIRQRSRPRWEGRSGHLTKEADVTARGCALRQTGLLAPNMIP